MMLLSYILGVVAALSATGRAQTVTVTTLSSSASSTTDSTASTITSASSSSSSSASASSTSVSTISIAVGANGFIFSPNQVNASVGDIIEWSFYPGGHTVVRAEYEFPCIPYERTGINKIGFYSGEISPQVITNDLPKFSVRVNDTDPIFYYCSAPSSCYQQHMIGVINANATETFDTQMLFADNATYQLSPTDPWPSETVVSTSSATAGSSSSSSSSHLGGGAIAGIAVGGAAGLALIGAIIFLCGRRGGLKLAYRHSQAPEYPGGPVPGGPAVGPAGAQIAFVSPKSPGSATFSTTQYSDHPSQHPHDSWRGMSPQPMSPSLQSSYSNAGQHQPQYAMYQPGMMVPGMHSPPMGMDMQGAQAGYFPVHATPPPEPVPQAPPVELPTSQDPGNSPLPAYVMPDQARFSWNRSGEGGYRPTSKP